MSKAEYLAHLEELLRWLKAALDCVSDPDTRDAIKALIIHAESERQLMRQKRSAAG